jgi:hypothetical protein
VIKTLIQMATQALITKAIMASLAVVLVGCSVVFLGSKRCGKQWNCYSKRGREFFV